MIKDTMKKIRSRIQAAETIPQKNKAELLSLLSRLESEITSLSKARPEHAESITGFMDRSTHEATRREKKPELLRLALAGLAESVKEFEASHPRLAEDINYISTTLANMGI